MRATLNPLVATRRLVVAGEPDARTNVARVLTLGSAELSAEEAYALLVSEGLEPAWVTGSDIAIAIAANIDVGRVGGVPIAQLNTDAARVRAYDVLAR